MNLAEYLNLWYRNHCLTLRVNTYKIYRQYLDRYIIPRLGHLELVEITPLLLQSFVADLRLNGRQKGPEPLNAKTVRQAFRILSKALSAATIQGLILFNPCQGVELPKIVRYRFKALRQAPEITAFVQAFRSTPFYLPVALAAMLGLRRSEVLGLRWPDFDFIAGTVSIQRSLVENPDGSITVDGLKSDDSYRVLPLPASLRSYLASLPHSNGFVVARPDGSPWKPSSFSQQYGSCRNRLGLPHLRFHDLRHSAASYLFAQGVDMRNIKDLLGHSTEQITSYYYVDTDIDSLRPSAALLDKISL